VFKLCDNVFIRHGIYAGQPAEVVYVYQHQGDDPSYTVLVNGRRVFYFEGELTTENFCAAP
jgi:hypothetical protein